MSCTTVLFNEAKIASCLIDNDCGEPLKKMEAPFGLVSVEAKVIVVKEFWIPLCPLLPQFSGFELLTLRLLKRKC